MQPDIEARLLQLNRAFYQSFATAFAETRERPQPGVMESLSSLGLRESLLDLGCGNGNLASALAERGHEGRYVGLDFSPRLLEAARISVQHPAASFEMADLAEPGWSEGLGSPFDWICLLAAVHHIPGEARRERLVREAAEQLRPGGKMLASVWNFMEEPHLSERVVPWSEAKLSDQQVDPGDYLLDWRRGGRGLRYVHLFSPEDLAALGGAADLELIETRFAGGDSGRLNLLQLWRRPEF